MRAFAPRIDEYLRKFSEKRRVGLRLKCFRLATGLSQREFGEHFGLARSTISGIERGRSMPQLKMLRTLRTLFQLSTDSILYDDEAHDIRTIRGYDLLTIPNAR